MNQPLHLRICLAILLLAGSCLGLPAAELSITNLPALQTNTPPSKTKPTAAERRTRIEAWRQEHGNLPPPKPTNAPTVDTKKLSHEERRARIKAQLAEYEKKRAATNKPPVTAPSNSPAK